MYEACSPDSCSDRLETGSLGDQGKVSGLPSQSITFKNKDTPILSFQGSVDLVVLSLSSQPPDIIY